MLGVIKNENPANGGNVMTNRTRAWRRRKTRIILEKLRDTRAWLKKVLEASKETRLKTSEPLKELKPHRHGKLTHSQRLKYEVALYQELRENWSGA